MICKLRSGNLRLKSLAINVYHRCSFKRDVEERQKFCILDKTKVVKAYSNSLGCFSTCPAAVEHQSMSCEVWLRNMLAWVRVEPSQAVDNQ